MYLRFSVKTAKQYCWLRKYNFQPWIISTQKPCALIFYSLVVILNWYSASFSELCSLNTFSLLTKVLKNRVATDQLTLCQNLKKIEQNSRFENSVLCTKFVKNSSWRKGVLKFLRHLLFSPNSHFHNQQLFGFFYWKFEINSTKIRPSSSNVTLKGNWGLKFPFYTWKY